MPHPRRQSQGPHVACGCPIVSLSLPGSWCLVWVRVSLESLISFSSDPSPHSAVLPRPSEVQNNGQCLAPTVCPCLCPPSRPVRLASVSQWAWLRLDLPRSHGQAPPHALDKAANITPASFPLRARQTRPSAVNLAVPLPISTCRHTQTRDTLRSHLNHLKRLFVLDTHGTNPECTRQECRENPIKYLDARFAFPEA